MNARVIGDGTTEDKILEYIESKPRGTWVEKIARELSLNRATVTKYVMRLQGAGKIEVEQEGQMNRIFPLTNSKVS